MKTFKDSKGRSWTIEVNIASAKRVKDLLSLNLLEPESGEPTLISRLCQDPMLLSDVCYVICKPDADRQNITAEEFASGLDGRTLSDMFGAFWEDYQNFFREGKITQSLALVQKHIQLWEMGRKMTMEKMEQVDMNQMSSKLSTLLQEHLDSIQDI